MRFAIVNAKGNVLSLVDLDDAPDAKDLEDGHRAVALDDEADIEIDGTFDEDDAYTPPIKVKHVGEEGATLYAIVDLATGEVVNVTKAHDDWRPPAGTRKVAGSFAIGGTFDEDDVYTPPASTPPPAPPMRGIVWKTDIWRRATDEEAEAMDAALAAAPAKLRRLYNDAQYIEHSADEFPLLRAGIIAALGGNEARADELLAASA